MFAIVEAGGKQFRVQEGLTVKVAKMDAEAGSELSLDKVLMAGEGEDLKIGTPYVDGAKVTCQVVEHGRDKKIIVFKKKRRKDYRKKQGHRQDFTTLKVTAIQA
ncbi:50S ribosomal protein L21 [Desulfoplanes formicivorans]|uniref:Large ribosomal subunit protein bL21 n=1 Tax=Desulfoplanes formicivorans TaxID=1592317 RepID=A0A194AC62_9BACT|nr:50S ribosomal protein L21 [Desulfoplanes formicivorans]GAU07737.1 50S ribosomal protein L21 [Desulfoplanes formicivorans]